MYSIKSEAAPPLINVFRYLGGVEERQREKLTRLRQSRNNERMGVALAELKAACKEVVNILSCSVACARVRCTELELFKVFKEAFGLWKPPALWKRRPAPQEKSRSRNRTTEGQRFVAKTIKMLLAKLGLDVHNMGIITVAKEWEMTAWRSSTSENPSPGKSVQTAIQEDVDVIGISSLGGAHHTLGMPLIDIARNEGLTDSVVFVIGGVFLPDDTVCLKEIGFDAVFTPGATRDEIVHTVQGMVGEKTI